MPRGMAAASASSSSAVAVAGAGTAKQKMERQQRASAKRQMSAIAAGFVQGMDVPANLNERLSEPMQKLMQEGFVVDTSAVKVATAVEAHAVQEHLIFQHALVARTAQQMPGFMANVHRQELRARQMPFQLEMDNRRVRNEGKGADYTEAQDRNAELGNRYDVLRKEAIEKEARVEHLAIELEEVEQECGANDVAGRYQDARVHQMETMWQTLEVACQAKDDEEATMNHMRKRIEEYMFMKRAEADKKKKEFQDIEMECHKLLISQGSLDQQTTKMTQGTAKFRNFLAIERRGREKEMAERRKMASRYKAEVERREARQREVEWRAKLDSLSGAAASTRTTTFRQQLVNSMKESNASEAAEADAAMRFLARRLSIPPDQLLERLNSLRSEHGRLSSEVSKAEGKQRALAKKLADAKDTLMQYATQEADEDGLSYTAQEAAAERKLREVTKRLDAAVAEEEAAQRFMRQAAFFFRGQLALLPDEIHPPPWAEQAGWRSKRTSKEMQAVMEAEEVGAPEGAAPGQVEGSDGCAPTAAASPAPAAAAGAVGGVAMLAPASLDDHSNGAGLRPIPEGAPGASAPGTSAPGTSASDSRPDSPGQDDDAFLLADEFDGEMIGGVPGDRGRRGGVVFAAPAAADQISRRGAITRSKEEIEALLSLRELNSSLSYLQPYASASFPHELHTYSRIKEEEEERRRLALLQADRDSPRQHLLVQTAPSRRRLISHEISHEDSELGGTRRNLLAGGGGGEPPSPTAAASPVMAGAVLGPAAAVPTGFRPASAFPASSSMPSGLGLGGGGGGGVGFGVGSPELFRPNNIRVAVAVHSSAEDLRRPLQGAPHGPKHNPPPRFGSPTQGRPKGDGASAGSPASGPHLPHSPHSPPEGGGGGGGGAGGAYHSTAFVTQQAPLSTVGGLRSWEYGVEEPTDADDLEDDRDWMGKYLQNSEDLYADDINFHHFKQFKVNPIVHEKRGVVGFSKTRRRDMRAANAQWVRECAGERVREVTIIRAKERPSSAAGFQLPPRAGVAAAGATSPTGGTSRTRKSRERGDGERGASAGAATATIAGDATAAAGGGNEGRVAAGSGGGKLPARPASAAPMQPPRPASVAAGCSCSMAATLAPAGPAGGAQAAALPASASQPALTPASYTQFAKAAAARLNAGPKSPGPPGANTDKRQFIRC